MVVRVVVPLYWQFGCVRSFVKFAAAFAADSELTYHNVEHPGSHGGGPWPSA